MASKTVLAVIVVVTVATILAGAPAPALAINLLVGDSQGWRLGVNYNDWVDGHDFMVGDTLVFKYAKGRHTVVRATEESFADCSLQDNSLAVWTSGDDKVALNKSGNWWFFCGVDTHCQHGMKFNVTVLPVVKLSSSSPPARAHGGGVVAAAIAGVAVVVALLLF